MLTYLFIELFFAFFGPEFVGHRLEAFKPYFALVR